MYPREPDPSKQQYAKYPSSGPRKAALARILTRRWLAAFLALAVLIGALGTAIHVYTSGPAFTSTSAYTPGPAYTPSHTSTQGTPLPTVTTVPPASATPVPASATPVPATATMVPPGGALPSDAQCAQLVSATTSSEVRPDNTAANQRVPTAEQLASLAPWTSARGVDNRADAFRQRVTGDFTGTTDQILAWAGCKWGIDPDIVRAEAVTESTWHQNAVGDYTSDTSVCPPSPAWQGGQCAQSYGILQIKYRYYSSAFPMAREDTAFNADFVYGWLRACYEGWTNYMYADVPAAGYPPYHAGDIWGCVGFWFSGHWYSQDSLSYIATVKAHYTNKDWLAPSFANS